MGYIKFLKKYYKEYLKTKLKKAPKNETRIYENMGILTPKIGSNNIGDSIIYESIHNELKNLFPKSFFNDLPTQIHTTYDSQKLMAKKKLLFLAGSNLLSSNLDKRHQWKIHSGHKKFLYNKVVLFGCGWWQYQDEINSYTEKIYKNVLNDNLLHSARDQYTVDKLRTIGIENVVNTSCPTLWGMTTEKCNQIPLEKGKDVVTTLTSYYRNTVYDNRMLEILSKNYRNVFLWLQGLNDFDYYREIDPSLQNIKIIPPNLESYDKILKKNKVDYIGTRLHGGIRALQKDVRTLIIAVDNRAVEIGNDVNLNVKKRENIEEIKDYISEPIKTNIKLPLDNINEFKSHLEMS